MTTISDQLDALRDGDIARAEFDGVAGMFPSAVEGKVIASGDALFVGGSMVRNGNGGPGGGLTSVTILRPLLQPGDRVRHRGASGTYSRGTVESVDGPFAVVDYDDPNRNSEKRRRDGLERLPAAPEPEPVLPPLRGQWLRNPNSKGVHVIVRGPYLVGDQMRVDTRDWRATVVESRPLGWVLSNWTLFASPPEPPAHAVIAVQDFDGHWYCAYRSAGWGDYDGARKMWAQILDGKRVDTLRVLAVLDGDG